MSDFLTNHGVVVALVCAGFALVYGVLTTRSLLALSPGNERMREISAAVQEGARAYLNRQYTIIAGVGVVLFVALIPLQNIRVAIGFLIGGLCSGAAGYIGMNVSVRSNARVAEAARGGRGAARCTAAFRGGAVTGMLVVGLALARRRRLLRRAHLALRLVPQGRGRRADRPGLRRLADLGVRAPGRRHLHQGRRRGRRPRGQDRGGDPRGRPAQPGRDRRQRGRQRRRLRRHGGRPLRDLRGDRGGRDAPGRRHLRARGRGQGRALPPRAGRRGDRRLDHRDLRGALRQRRARALPGADRLRRDRGARPSTRSPTG